MIEERHLRTLSRLWRGLEDSDVRWMVTASLNLALHGLPVQVHDIDVLTDEAGAYEIERRFAQHSTQAVCLRTSECIRSHFGSLCLEGVTIEIMGDVETYDEVNGWRPTPGSAGNSEVILLQGMPIPVRTLEAEYAAYLQLGRAEKAELVRRWLQSH